MAEYIEREAAMSAQNKSMNLAECRKRLERLPAADVAPVRHGRWVLTTQPLGWRDEDCAECSECGEDFILDEWGIDDVKDAMRYCPNCGALMEEGR